MTTLTGEPICCAPAGDRCGEGVLWHPGEGVVYWTDIPRFLIHRFDPAGGDQRIVGRSVLVGDNRDLVAENIAFVVSRQIEVAVIGEVHGRGFVGRGGVVDAELVAFCIQCVRYYRF